jgi:hypothetical protein
MRRKLVPLRPSRLPDSGGIFTFSNEVRMEKLSRSVHRAKQAKILMLTVPVRTVHTGHVSSPYSPYMTCGKTVQHTWPVLTGHVAALGSDTWHAVLDFLAHSWANPKVTRVTTGRVTRGTGDVSI